MEQLSDCELKEEINYISNEYFNKSFIGYARYNHRLRTTGGRYIPAKRTIEVNPKYVREMSSNEVKGIIKHELCHYHLHIEGKAFGHGDQTFKKLLKQTNSPRFCKPLPSILKKQVIHTYVCGTCSTIYNRRRRVNISRVQCGKCGNQIVYKDSTK